MNKKPLKKYLILLVVLFGLFSGNKTKAQQNTAAAGNAGGFVFTYKNQNFSVDQAGIDSWKSSQEINSPLIFLKLPLGPLGLIANSTGKNLPEKSNSKIFYFNLNKIYTFIKQLSPKINVPSVEPVLKIQDNRATSFTPPQTGLEINIYSSTLAAESVLENGGNNLELKISESPPKTSLSELNGLGINELVGEGVSAFKGSPNNRRHNIAVGLEKFKGIIIPPNEEFSFNQYLGPVTAEVGFLPELVIKGSEGTIPELGGGLCQVSTTVFRAAMSAGFPITDRRNHAYAVQYYSPQGTDATIYPGSADLKFINDTPASILVWAYEKDPNTLIFDFYGTKDGRQVTLEKPIVYDKQADGSMKATWTRIILKNGETSTSTFKSVYQPPALFHKTENFVSSTGTIVSSLKPPAVKAQ